MLLRKWFLGLRKTKTKRMQTKFFYSIFGLFLIIASCRQIDPNMQIDEGLVENNVYTSEEIGWTITIPENWEVVSRAQNEAFRKKGLGAMEETLDQEIDVSGLKDLIGFKKNRFNLFQSSSEPFVSQFNGDWEENNAGLKAILFNTYTDQGIKVDTSATSITTVDGIDFHTYEFTLYGREGEVVLKQQMYSQLINGFDFGVNINYNNEADKQVMLDAWMNSKFKK